MHRLSVSPLALGAVALLGLVACHDATGATAPGRSVFVGAFLGDAMPVVSGGAVFARIGPIPAQSEAAASLTAALSPDSAVLYVMGADGVAGFNALMAIDTRALRVLWSDSAILSPARLTDPNAVQFSDNGA